MYELQQYKQALVTTVTFPIEIAQEILGIMESIFGSDFERVHGATDAEILVETFRFTLDGLTPQDIGNGLKNMRSEKWCPALSEFRRLCFQDDSWWTAEIAWAKALNWKKNNNEPITILARKTMLDVSEIFTTQGQKAAYKSFIETYELNLREARKQGRTQLMWIKPNRTNSDEKQKEFEQKQAERTRTASPMPANLASQAELIYKRAGKTI